MSRKPGMDIYGFVVWPRRLGKGDVHRTKRGAIIASEKVAGTWKSCAGISGFKDARCRDRGVNGGGNGGVHIHVGDGTSAHGAAIIEVRRIAAEMGAAIN